MRNAPAWSAARRIGHQRRQCQFGLAFRYDGMGNVPNVTPRSRYQRQDAQRNYEHAYRTLSTGECLLCVEELSAKARPAWYRPDGINEALAIMRKIAAVAVRAMENHGVIPR